MITIFQMAIQTILGWTVLTCGVPMDAYPQPGEGFKKMDYVCLIEVDGHKFAAEGTLYRVVEGEPPRLGDYQ